MQQVSSWNTGFLTRLIWLYLQRHYPQQAAKTDPLSFFSVFEGSGALKDPAGLLLDSHGWLPEEVLRELLKTAEGISGQKDVAYHAALDYFDSSRKGLNPPDSLFEIIVRSFTDVRSVAVLSGLWGEVYTTFMRLQALVTDSRANEVTILSQAREGFRPLLANHFMVKGNYEGFALLFDSVREARMDDVYLQYRVQDILAEFPGYHMIEEEGSLKIVDAKGLSVISELRPLELGHDTIISSIPFGDLDPRKKEELPFDMADLIVSPSAFRGNAPAFTVFSGEIRENSGEESRELGNHGEDSGKALRVVREGTLHAGKAAYTFKKDMVYNAPYSRYRFTWKDSPVKRPAQALPPGQAEDLTRKLFSCLGEAKKTQLRLLAYAIENRNLKNDNFFLMEEAGRGQKKTEGPGWSGKSPAMVPVIELVRQSGPTEATILVTGETGTGKEVIARRIHQESPRGSRRFVSVNCGAIPEGLMESELFGHERGAFTGAVSRKIGKFEWANGGTLFLDEIGELPLFMQVKLLRVLQERELQRVGGQDTIPLDIRIIAATNQDLQEGIEKGRFRKDLFYRLNVIPIPLPPLRERLEDIEDLALSFLKRFSGKNRKQVREISPLTLDLMRSYSWPGNIRELENLMERVVILLPPNQTILNPENLPPEIRSLVSPAKSGEEMEPSSSAGVTDMIERIEWPRLVKAMDTEGSMDSFLRKIEWAMAQRAISHCGSKTEAARVLKRTYRWIRKLEKEMTEGPSA